jgi:lipopolysaccharide transport system ATP-binding protein
MANTAIQVDKLGKLYRLGLKEETHDTLAENLWSWVKTPLRNYKRLRGLNTYGIDEDSDELFWALKEVSFTVDTGEVVGIIGRNGAGKSTLLKVLSRITEPTRGRALINGRVGSLLEVGTGFHHELTGRDNVYMNGTILGMSKTEIDRKFDEIVDFSGVEKFLDTPIKRYSSGMMVRLAFSVAAHLEPEILIIDEVLAVGDAAFQKKCLGKMHDVASEGRTILFVSHQLGAVNELCSTCYLMSNGRIVANGTPEEVIRQYLDTGQQAVGYVDLRNWSAERFGEGPSRIEYIELSKESGEVTPFFDYGEPLNIKVGVQGRSGDECHIGIRIVNWLGQLVLHFTEDDFCETLHYPDNRAEIIMRLEEVCLNEGSYFITVWLGSGGAMHDTVANCIEMNVNTSKLGKIRARSSVLLPAKWAIRRAGD